MAAIIWSSLLNPDSIVAEGRWANLQVSVWAGRLRISLTKSSVPGILVVHLHLAFAIQEVRMACGDTVKWWLPVLGVIHTVPSPALTQAYLHQ